MKDPDKSVRIAAVATLGNLGGPLASARLTAVLTQPYPETVVKAVEYLYRIADGDSAEPLGLFLTDSSKKLDVNGDVRNRCRRLVIRTLGRLKDKRAVDALTAEMNDPKSPYHREALRAMCMIQDPSAVPAIIAAASHADSRVHIPALTNLAARADKRALDTLIKAAATQKKNTRYYIVLGIARIDPVKAFDPFTAFLTAQTKSASNQALAKALTAEKNKNLSSALIKLLKHKDAAIRHVAENYLKIIGDEKGLKAIEDAKPKTNT